MEARAFAPKFAERAAGWFRFCPDRAGKGRLDKERQNCFVCRAASDAKTAACRYAWTRCPQSLYWSRHSSDGCRGSAVRGFRYGQEVADVGGPDKRADRDPLFGSTRRTRPMLSARNRDRETVVFEIDSHSMNAAVWVAIAFHLQRRLAQRQQLVYKKQSSPLTLTVDLLGL